MPIVVAQFPQQLAERHGRVVHRPAENAGVQVARRAAQRDLEANNPPQCIGQCRMFERWHARIGNDDCIAGQLCPVLSQKGCQAAAAYLLFAFNDEGNITRQLGPGLEVSLYRLEVSQVLALVVARAPRVKHAVSDARLEGRRLPQLQRFGRLHVVMPVNHEVRTAPAFSFPARRLRHDDGVPGCRAKPRLQADLPAMLHQPGGARLHIAAVLWLSGNAREPQILAEFADEARLVLLQIINDALHPQPSTTDARRREGKSGPSTSSSARKAPRLDC